MYFITFCIKNRFNLLGKIENENLILTEEGKIAKKYLNTIELIYKNVEIDEYIIMPNHVHMIITIHKQTNITIQRIIKQYKEIVTKQIGESIWQKSFYEHIIRNEEEYYKIKKYIQDNVINWETDIYF